MWLRRNGKMRLNRVGKTDLYLSAVGLGTAQLRMVSEQQALATLRRAFDLGVNWVHTAPDYGGAEEIVARAIRESGRKDLVMATACYGSAQKAEELFEGACAMLGKKCLDLYGIACIDDREFVKENVWEPGGQVEFLLEKKREGRIRALFCTTHASPDRVSRLVECGVFDAIMLAYNPLGFHVLSYHAASEGGKPYEDIEENRRRIFPLARDHEVSLLIMKPLAGGLLCASKAFPPRHRFSVPASEVTAADVLRSILRLPGVTAVCPGTASVEEAEENARAGHEPLDLPEPAARKVGAVADQMRTELCSRCGACESTCSKHLQISWMVREAYMWSYPADSFDTIDRHHYFTRYPSTALACATCTERTCECPAGLDVPSLLQRVHHQILTYRADGSMHAAPADRPAFDGYLRGSIVLAEIPRALPVRTGGTARLWLENGGPRRWSPMITDDIHDRVYLRATAPGLGSLDAPLRHMIEPGERAYFVFDLPPVAEANTYDVEFELISPAHEARPERRTRVMATRIAVGQPGVGRLPALGDEVRTPDSYGARHLAWTVPGSMAPGSCRPISLELQNTGTMTWRSRPPLGNRICVGLFCDDQLHATLELGVESVPPGGTVTINHRFVAPTQPGRHVLRFGLVELEVARFSDRGVPPLEVAFTVTGEPDPVTTLSAAARRVNPWHYFPTGGVSTALDGTIFPSFVDKAYGCRIRDVTGREFIDYTMGWGTTVLGYAHPHVQAALARAIQSAPLLAYVQPIEIEVSQMLIEEFPGTGIVAFGKNGSDVCTLAARIARVHTGRRQILYCGYHGWGDFWVEQHGFARTGVPDRGERLIHRFRFNDMDSFLELFERHREDLACVMLEPSGPWGGNDIGHEPDADQAFLELLRRKTVEAGALLVFDEIITGFRYPQNSVQRARGVRPDLTCLGKALASGMPLSALLGPTAIMKEAYPRAHYGPTFREEAYSFHAAKATIEFLRREPVTQHVWDHGQQLRGVVEAAMASAGLRAVVKGPPFRMSLFLDEPDPARKLRMRTLLQQELLRAGISIFNNGVMLPCYAHDATTLQQTADAMTRAAALVRRAVDERDLDQRIEIPLLADM